MPHGARSKHSCPGMGDARLALLSRVTRARILYSSREFEFWSDSKSPEKRAIVTCKIRKFWCPGEDSNLSRKFSQNQAVGAVGLLSYPESYPHQSRAAMGPLGIGWARMSRHRDDPHIPCAPRRHELLDAELDVLRSGIAGAQSSASRAGTRSRTMVRVLVRREHLVPTGGSRRPRRSSVMSR